MQAMGKAKNNSFKQRNRLEITMHCRESSGPFMSKSNQVSLIH
jgi:hypothetical protein